MLIHERVVETGNVRLLEFDAQPEARLRQWVKRFAIPRHAFVNSEGNTWVRQELASAFERLGLVVQIQGKHQNVLALPTAPKASPLTLVAAHYDSVPHCPGADDNASGLAVMLECARALTESGHGQNVGFVAFNAEEDGLLGSRDFVAYGLPALRRQVRLAHVLEMVGYRCPASVAQHLPLPWVPASLKRADFIGLLSKGASNGAVDNALRSRVAPHLRLIAAKTWGPMHTVFPDITRSDHFPFWGAGIPAALWTDTGDFRNPHYHSVTDTPDTLDYAFMREVAELLCAVVSAECT